MNEYKDFHLFCGIGAACPVPYMMQPAVQTAPPDLFTTMLKVAYKLGAGEELTNDEHDFFADFCMMTRAATAHDFIQMERLIDNHWHRGMTIAESRKYHQEMKKNTFVAGNINE